MSQAQPSGRPTEQQQLLIKLESIFMPYASKQREALYTKDTSARFVHYTSAESALSIIKSRRLWMRNTTCMTDYREVQHGFGILNEFFRNKVKKQRFCRAIDTCAQGAADEAITMFNHWWHDIQFHTYIASISEHDKKEDLHGRLSMWRTFGGNAARVALVFKVPRYSDIAANLNLIFSPVAYLTHVEVDVMIHLIMRRVRANKDFLRTVNRLYVIHYTFAMLVSGVVCLKHEGFHEEREWRVIYSPNRAPSPLIEPSTEMIGGVPQMIYKLPLDGSVSDTVADLDFSRMFDRLIVGPSPYPGVMYEAFVAALQTIGIADASQRVFTSGIPIRA